MKRLSWSLGAASWWDWHCDAHRGVSLFQDIHVLVAAFGVKNEWCDDYVVTHTSFVMKFLVWRQGSGRVFAAKCGIFSDYVQLDVESQWG